MLLINSKNNKMKTNAIIIILVIILSMILSQARVCSSEVITDENRDTQCSEKIINILLK